MAKTEKLLDDALKSVIDRLKYIPSIDSDGVQTRHAVVALHNLVNIYENQTQTLDSDEYFWFGDIPAFHMTYEPFTDATGGTTQTPGYHQPEEAEHDVEIAAGCYDYWGATDASAGGPKSYCIIPSLNKDSHVAIGHPSCLTTRKNYRFDEFHHEDYPEKFITIVPIRNTTKNDIVIPAGNIQSYGSSSTETNWSQSDIMFFTPNNTNTFRDEIDSVSYVQLSRNTTGGIRVENTSTVDVTVPANTTCILMFRNSNYTVATNDGGASGYEPNWSSTVAQYQIINNISNVVDGKNIIVDTGVLETIASQQSRNIYDLWTQSTPTAMKRVNNAR